MQLTAHAVSLAKLNSLTWRGGDVASSGKYAGRLCRVGHLMVLSQDHCLQDSCCAACEILWQMRVATVCTAWDWLCRLMLAQMLGLRF
jgi:hypothetical protein